MEQQISEVSACLADFREAVRLYKATRSKQRSKKVAGTSVALSKAFAALVKDRNSCVPLANAAVLLSSSQRLDGISQKNVPAALAEFEHQVTLLLSSFPLQNEEALAGSEFAPSSSLFHSWPLPETHLSNILKAGSFSQRLP